EDRKDKQGKPISHVRLHLVFDEQGRLAEQQLVEMPAKKVLGRAVFSPGGDVRILDEKEKEVATVKGKLERAEGPNLQPDVKNLFVLPLPYSTRQHVVEPRKLKDRRNEDLPCDDAFALSAGDF